MPLAERSPARALRLSIYDHGPQAVKIREAFDSIAVNIKTFTTVEYSDEVQAREDVRTGKIDAAVIIPAQYSRRVYAQDAPQIGLVVDNTDQFTSGSIESEMQLLVAALTRSGDSAAVGQSGSHWRLSSSIPMSIT